MPGLSVRLSDNPKFRTAALLGAAVLVFAAGAAAHWGWSLWKTRAVFVEQARDPTVRATYRHRLTLFDALHSRPTVVMLGDSITQWGEWSELIGPQVANRGIGGDTSSGLLKRLDRSVPPSATTVVIMIGLNDLKAPDWTAARSVRNVRAILQRLKGRRVILQSVLPTSSPRLNGQIDALNRELKPLCAEGSCEWLDLAPVIAPDDVLGRDMTEDGRHLSGKGYGLWAAALKARL